jgi:hypothetical protein
MSGMVTPVRSQNAFRGRNDNGSQTTATWKANQNTNWTQDVGETFRVRFRIQETAGGSTVDTYKVQFNKNGAGFVDVGTATDCRVVDSANITEDEATTSQLTGGSGSFVAGVVTEADAIIPTAGNISLVASGYSEVEVVLRLQSGAWSTGNTCVLRLVENNGTLFAGTYTNPTITANVPADVTAPTNPTNLAATDVEDPVLTWTASTDAIGVTKYEIERSTVGGGSGFSKIGEVTGAPPLTTYTDTTAAAATTYYYRVRAGDAVPNWSGYSAEDTATTPAAPINTAYRVSFPTPGTALVAGADLQEFSAQVYVDGAGSPTGALYLYENGVQVGSSIWSGTVTGTEASPATISGTWDATGRTASQIEARFVGTGVSGGTAKLYAIEWNATVELPAGNEPISLTGVTSEETVGVLTETPGIATKSLVGVASEESVGALTEAPGTVTRTLVGVASDEQVGTLTASVHTFVALTGVSSDEGVGALTPAAGDVSKPLTGLASEESVGVLAEQPGTVARALIGLTTEESVGVLTEAPGVSAQPLVGLPTDELVGTLGVIASIALTGVASEEQVGTLVATPGDVTVALTGVPTDELVGALSTAGETFVPLTGVSSDEQVGALTELPGEVTHALIGLPTEER